MTNSIVPRDKLARRANQYKSLSIPSRKNIPLNLSGKSAA
jgi:hypothetical protein